MTLPRPATHPSHRPHRPHRPHRVTVIAVPPVTTFDLSIPEMASARRASGRIRPTR